MIKKDHNKQVSIALKVIPSARRNEVVLESDVLKVYLKAPAVDGKANDALIEVLAHHFDVKKLQIEIIKGLKSRHKVVNITHIS